MLVKKEIDFIDIPVQVNKTIKDVLGIYSSLHVSRNALLDNYLGVITTKNIESAYNPWLYLYKGIKKLDIEHGESDLEKAFNEAALKLKRQKPTDVIRAAFYKKRNDSALECGYLLSEYMMMLSEDEDALIINPSPDMILQFEEGRLGKGINYYVVTDTTIAKIYSTQFARAKFYAFNDRISKMFQAVLIVNRDTPIEETDMLMRWLICAKERVLAQIPNAYLDNLKYGALAQFQRCEFGIESVLLLDRNSTVTSPKKKCLLYLNKKSNEAINLLGSECDRKNKKLTIIDKGISLKTEDYWKHHRHLIGIWDAPERKNEEKHEAKYVKAKEYLFSEEIHLSYTIYKDVRNVYTGRCWYRKLDSINPEKYVRRVTPFIEKGLQGQAEEEVEKKLWQVVFDERVFPYIYSDIREFYLDENRPISLKTLWVACHNLLCAHSLYNKDIFIELFSDLTSGICAYQNENHSVDDLVRMLESHLQTSKDDIPTKYYRQLNLLFETAKKEKYIRYNPLAELMGTINKRASERQQDIRQVLTKKHFSSKEEQQIFEYLVEPVWSDFYDANVPRCVEESIWLVGAIRLFTGMTLREACALRWSDFVVLEGTMEYQLEVSKFVDEQGKIITHAQKEDWTRFRCVPVAHPLKVLLEQRRKYLRDRNIEATVLDKSPIVLSREEIKSLRSGGRSLFCKPAKAQEYCKRLVEQANISEQLLILPDAKGEMITDVHKYHGDIFVSNLRRQLNQCCKMTMGEINYILGVVGNDTFSRHYCDYSNELVLYAMIQKMSRWTSKYEFNLSRIKSAKATKGELHTSRQVIKSGPYHEGCASGQIVLKSESKLEETVKVTIECEHGAKVEITKYRGE